MTAFRTILAALLALLIASPLCCCSARAADANDAPSCCEMEKGGKGQPEKDSHVCACTTKQPRDEAKKAELSQDAGLLFAPPVVHLPYLNPFETGLRLQVSTPHTGSDPPRLLLARYARWLT